MSRYREALSADVIAIHDKQKDFSDSMWRDLVDALRIRIRDGGLVIDAGVGSGVVASRLASAGFAVVGFDFNESMLRALQRRAGPAVPAGLADVTALPVRDGCADAVVITNVLHLLRDWRTAIADASRALKSGGVLLVGLGNTGRSPTAGEIGAHFRSEVGEAGLAAELGVQSADDFETALRAYGFEPEEPLVVGETVRRTVLDAIERLQHNVFTWPPDLPQHVLDEAAAATTEWAVERFGSLDAEYDLEAELFLHAARKA